MLKEPKILHDIGWNKTPLSFEDFLLLCERLGVRVFYHEGVSEGMHFIRHGKPVIVLNKYLSGFWQTFVAWHELAHYLLGHTGALRYFVKGSQEKAELQANIVGICAIMPEPFIYEIAFGSPEIFLMPKELIELRIKIAQRHNI